MDAHIFLRTTIIPALTIMNMSDQAGEELLLGTAIQESGCRAVIQKGGGPALGPFQMEKLTHDDCWDTFLNIGRNVNLGRLILRLIPPVERRMIPDAQCLISYPMYAAAMCRVKYLRDPHPIPKAGDLDSQAAYWKRVYNTEQGRGTVQEYMLHYQQAMAATIEG